MAENIQTTLQFQADITDFRSAMQEANRAVKLANSEFKAATAGMDDWGSSTDGLTAKLRQLSTVQEAEQRKLDVLKASYAEVAREQGENSAAALDLQIKINNQQAVVNKAAADFGKYAERLAEVENAADGAAVDIDKAGDAVRDAGNAVQESTDGWSIAKDVIADFVSNAISSAVDALMNLAESTREYRREMALMAENAANSGNSMATVKDTLAGVAAITGDADAAMEGLNMLMATGFRSDNLTFAAEALSGAAAKFDGVNFEGIAEGLQETLATGAAVGPFAEVIERSGGDLEKFNQGLAACTTEAQKQQYALDWLANSGLKATHDAYVQNNADLVAAEQAQFRYNDAMASVGAALEPINAKLTQIGATILEKVAPAVEEIVQWVLTNLPTIEPIIAGIAVALGVLAAALGIQALISGVTKAFALLNTTMLANPFVMIAALVAGIVTAVVALWNKSEAFRNFWKNLWEGIKTFFSGIVKWFSDAAAKIAKFFADAWANIKKVWSAVTGFFSNIYKGITNAFANIGKWFGDKFGGAWDAVKKAFSSSIVGQYFGQVWETVKGIFSVVKNVLSGNFSDAWQGIKNVFAGWGDFFSGLWDKVKSVFANVGSSMLSVGKNIVEGIWNGISNGFNWIKNKITGWVGNVMDFIKNLFGINSPSTVMRDEVGKMLGLGMAEGIQQSRRTVQNAMHDLSGATLDGIPRTSGGSGAAPAAPAGKTIVFNQTNNSPKALSRREIYRQTHNALAIAGGA